MPALGGVYLNDWRGTRQVFWSGRQITEPGQSAESIRRQTFSFAGGFASFVSAHPDRSITDAGKFAPFYGVWHFSLPALECSTPEHGECQLLTKNSIILDFSDFRNGYFWINCLGCCLLTASKTIYGGRWLHVSIPLFMSSFHDQIFSEIDAARKLAAEFASRHARNPERAARVPSSTERLAQEEAAAAEIAALAAEEERLANEARERANDRAKAQAEKKAIVEEARESSPASKQAESRWNAMAILKALAKLRARERSAAEALIRKAHEVREQTPGAANHEPYGQKRGSKQSSDPVRGMWTPSLGATQVWYFTSEGTRCGPVTFGELRTMAASRVLDPRLDMVWKEGMEGWKQAGIINGLFERRTIPAETPDTRGGKSPRKVTALPRDLTAALATKHMYWPGVGRLTLWLGLLLFPLLWSQFLWWSAPILFASFGSALTFKLLPFARIVPIAVVFYLVLMRLVNVGMSRWWALVIAIPVLNLWVGFRCLVCPSGYAHHRKLDRIGMAIALVVVVTIPSIWYIHAK